MERRAFLVGLGLAVLAAPVLTLPGCGGGGDSSTSPTPPPDGFDVQSSTDLAHSHSVRVLNADLANPPSGVTYTSTTVSAHVHMISLSGTQLAAIQGGQTVTVNSNLTSGHRHSWTIRKP
jgi:hypothetical protein